MVEPTLTRTIEAIAQAFERRDVVALRPHVSDSYDGLRFASTWDEATWARFARAFRRARLLRQTTDSATFEIVIDPHAPDAPTERKEIELSRHDERGWQLIYRTFMVTPHIHEQ